MKMRENKLWLKAITGIILAGGITSSSVFAEVLLENYSSPDAAKKLNLKPSEWKIDGSEITSINAIKGMNTFEFGSPDWADYEVEFKLKRLQVSPKDQHFGITVRNSANGSVRLYSRGDSIIYIAGSRHEVLGNLPVPLSVGDQAPWTSFRVSISGSALKVWVDGVQIGTVNDIVPDSGKIMFYAYSLDVAMTDLKVIVARTGGETIVFNATSKNILHNSGFEQCTLDDLPDYWGVPHWGLSEPYWAVRFEEWQKHFITDKTVAYEGKRSLKIVNPENKPSSGLTLWSVCMGSKQNEKYALSAYMKSEPAGIKVKLDKETFTLTDKWQRYSTTFVNDNKQGLYSDMLNIVPLEKGTVWIDAVQLENGLMTEYQPLKNEKQQLEVQEGNVNKILTEVPKYQPPYYDQTLTLTGKLDDKIWENVPKMKFVTSAGVATKDPTEAQVWYNGKGIYVGVKCFDQNASKNKCSVTARDGNIWNDPSLELFIDPQLSRNYYYHLAVNQAGVQYDGFNGDMSWNGDWKVLTYTDPSGKYWSAEIFLPFGELGLDRTAGDLWGFNICRENHAVKEYSCWSPTYGGFHSPTRFGQIGIDRKVQENYYVGCSEAKLQNVSGDKSALAVKLYNNTAQDRNYNLSGRLLDQTNKKVADFSKSVNLKKGVEAIFELGNANCPAGAKYSLALELRSNDNKTLCFSGVKDLETPEALSVQTQYDLYTGEDKMLARIQLNLGGELLAGAKLSLKIYDSAGKEVLSQNVDKLQQEIETEIGIGKLENGDYVLKAELKTGAATLAASKEFQKLPPVKNEVKADHFSRMAVVNGKPFFPFGIYLEGNSTPECIKYFAENGANCINAIVRIDNYPGMQNILDCAAGNNVKVVLQFNAPKDENEKKIVAKFIETFKDHPAVLAWFLYDEVFTLEWGKNNYPSVVIGCKEFKKLDPYRLSLINENSYGLSFLKNGKLDFPGEVISIDHYAFPPASSLQLVSTYAKTMWEAGRKDGKPCWMYLFGAGYTFWASRDLTPAEQEFETYVAIINGIRGISYFADHPKSKSNWARMKELFQEVKELSPALASTIKTPVIKCNSPAIEFLVKKTEAGVYLIAVNNTLEPVNARFDLSEVPLPVENSEVLFEGRKIRINQGTLEDNFKGFQRHVYLLK